MELHTYMVKDDGGQVVGAMVTAAPVSEEQRELFAALVRSAVEAYEALGPNERERRRVRGRVLTEHFT